MDELTPGPAMQCPIDETTIGVSERDQKTGLDCPECGDPMEPVTIEACPNGEQCDSEDHHYGLGMHVIGEG